MAARATGLPSVDRRWYAAFMVINTGAAIMERLIDPDNADLTPEAARSILRLDFPKRDHKRMASLSAKASAGTLTERDRAELEDYLRVADLLALLQSKARKSLKKPGNGSGRS